HVERATNHRGDIGVVRDVAGAQTRVAARGKDVANDPLAASRVDVVDDDLCALGRETRRNPLAKTRRRARYHRYLVREAHRWSVASQRGRVGDVAKTDARLSH